MKNKTKKIQKNFNPTKIILVNFYKHQIVIFFLNFPCKFFICIINLYRDYFSPLFPPSCRFYPSCSKYAITSFKKLGFWKGLTFTLWRVLKCNPFHQGGYDPVIFNEKSFYKKCKKNF